MKSKYLVALLIVITAGYYFAPVETVEIVTTIVKGWLENELE